MALLDIVIYPEEVLKTAAEPVERVDDEIRRMVDDMAETMYAAPGVGLAANQVDSLKRVAVIDVAYTEGDPELIVLINPEIVERSGRITWEEGCLSFPEINVDVDRSQKVEVRALDRDGKPFAIEAEDLLAVALQHEIDHLNGVTLADKVSFLRRKTIVRELSKLEKSKAS
ncbi:MAG: peptide deformylase [Polyangia bacterium]